MRNHREVGWASETARRLTRLALGAWLLTMVGAERARGVDVVVYGDHIPLTFHDGSAFQSPFTVQWEAGDPITRVGFQAATGVRNPLGTIQWGQTTFGKYVLSGAFGNYGFLIAPFDVEDLLINVLDSEEKDACMLDVTGPSVAESKAVRTLITANPNGRQSRIFIGGQLYAGFILADLDNPDPCSWPTVTIPNAGDGDPDGLAVLWHEDEPGNPFGRDYVAYPSWWGGHQRIFRVDSTGVQEIATYVLPYLARQGQCPIPQPPDRPCFEITCDPAVCVLPNQCYARGWPVQLPQVDRSRPKHDVRWTSFLELYFSKIDGSGGCGGYVAAQEYRIDLTAATPAIHPTSPVFHAAALGEGADAGVYVRTDTHPAGLDYDSAGGLWANLWRRKTVPSGGFFYPTDGGVFARKSGGQQCTVNQQSFTVGASGAPVPAGEHCYYDLARVNDMSRVKIDQLTGFDHSPLGFTNLRNVQVGNTMYVAGQHTVQRAKLTGGNWVYDPPSTYRVALPAGTLPAEPRFCADDSNHCDCPLGTPPDEPCADTDRCGAGVMCEPRAESIFSESFWKVQSAGGTPISLWTAHEWAFNPNPPEPWPRNSLYWNRVPITSKPADGLTGTMRPSLAWSGDRLWLATRHNGINMFRVRDDGIWSPWMALPAGPVDTQPTIAVNGSTVEIVAPGTSPEVYTLRLTSPLNCAPSACTWTGWSASTIGAKTTPSTPAAAYDLVGNLVVAIRGSDNLVYFGRRPANCDGVPWTQFGSLTTTEPPSLAWHPVENRFWIAIRDAQAGLVRIARFQPPESVANWEIVATGLGALGGKGPQLVWDGSRMRILSPDSSGAVHQAAHNGSTWTSWTRVPSRTTSDAPPGAAAVYGDVNLMTREGLTLSEAFVPAP